MELLPPGAFDEMLNRYPETLTIEECAEVLKVGPPQVGRLLRAGLLAASKPGRTWIIPRAGVRAYLLARGNRAAQALEHGEPLATLAATDPAVFGRRATDRVTRRCTD